MQWVIERDYKQAGHKLHQPRGLATTERLPTTVSIEQATIDSCFGLARAHQHGIAGTYRGGF